ncbi:GBS Bsp-like repeat-containing protein [Streptococcus gordonii]|uniref:Lysozyme n=7 Tax=Streptococcus TaxID=1301 RepID=Q83YQ2_STRGN|nr:GBS Bsp-like repeat-containing protein [Streptococcus gordonii]AAN64579.1 putative N-acetylmuramidase/lysin [Streptococcus gordonii]MBZ2148983.1 GBS Bsp-like repeat-containing protein [Streptococcus gordonii]
MKKKDFIYYASAALLLAVSVRPAYADEQESAVKPIQVKAEQDQDTVAKAVSDDSERVESKGETRTDRQEEQEKLQAEQKTENSQSVPASLPKQSETKVENQSESLEETVKREETSKVDEGTSKKGAVGNSTFYSTGHAGPASRSSDVAVQPKTFVDVSSHNGSISVNDYRTLANKGVGGVVVKLTEGTTYRNPYAGEQARNAQLAGLQVSAYAFSHYTSEEQARAEARHFISEARNLNLPKNTVMVNDMEDAKMKDNINRNTLAWADEMRKNGYTNLMYYTSASWIDENNLRGKGPVKTAQFGLENFWVAQYPTAKLSANDAKTLRYNGRAGAWQFTSQAELLPGKHVFDHSVDYTGRFTSQAKPAPEVPKGPLSGKISIENNDSLAGRFDVVISNVLAPQGVASVSVPVWSDDKGQDDLVWHHATRQQDGRYRVTVKASDHKNSTGKYHVHLYYTQLNGEQIGVTATTTEVSIGKTANKGKPSGKVTIENNNSTTGTFDAVIRDVVSPNGLNEVLVPTWSEVNGQDDLVWHKAVKQADGSYRATIKSGEHNNSQGKYQVHVHYIDGSGQRRYVTETVTEVHQSRPSGVLSIENQDQVSGTFDAVIRNVIAPNGLNEVLIPTWSEVNGQDDLIWHKAVKQADGSYRATIKSSEHKNSQGKYQVHVHYIDGSGQRRYVTETVTEVHQSRPSGVLSIENQDQVSGTFDAVVRNVVAPNGLKEVLVPTWSEANGQDDLIWHKAVKQADGSYRATIKSSEHKNSQGKYQVHVHYIDGSGQRRYVTETVTEVHQSRPSGVLSIENQNQISGTFDAVVRNVIAPNGLKEVLVPTWSEVNGQDDLVWHKAVKQADGSYRATIKSSEHKNSQGKYQVHVHYIDGSGQRRYVTETVTEVHQSRPSGVLSIENQNQISGTFDAVVRNVIAPNGLKEVLIPTWSEVNGQDDLIWHKAVKQADGSYRATIKSSEHKNSQGKYQVHVHYVDGSGQRRYVTETSTQLKLSQPTGKVNIQNNNKETGTFDVVVTDVFSPKGVQSVQVPVWSDQGGQDDLIWYNATRQSDGSYKASIKAENHKNSTGTYHVHLYYIQNDGSRIGVHSTTTQVEYHNLTHKTKAYIKDVNSQTGTFTVAVDQSAQGKRIKNIRAAVWSQAHQENLSWYTQTPAGGHTEIGIAAVNHGNKQGDYTTHVYVDYTDGSVEGFNLGQTRLMPHQVTDQKNRVIRAASNLVGTSTGSAAHQRMVEDYNSVKPLPVGYAVKNTDDWCDIFVTVVFQREGLSHLVGRECGVERHIQIFKKLGIWNEDGTTTPQSGDIITFNWDKDTQQNDGWADHIGIVERVENGWIHTIEGNSSNGVVRRNTYRVGHGNIRGFARPHYQ